MLYASPLGYPAIGVDTEMEMLSQAIEESRGPNSIRLSAGAATADSLTKLLTLSRVRRGVVVHLSAHATHAEGSEDGLVLEDSRGNGAPHILSRDTLEEVLGVAEQGLSGISLLFLSACKSEELAQVFVECGCRHVIATRHNVLDAAARQFSQNFYCSLLAGEPLLSAWEGARRALLMNPNPEFAKHVNSFLLFGQHGADRATLEVLCGCATSDGSIADVNEGPGCCLPGASSRARPEAHISGFEDASVLQDALSLLPPRVEDFAGRAADLKKILDVLRGRRACCLHGPEGIGKSALCVELARFSFAPGRLFSYSVLHVQVGETLDEAVAALEQAVDVLASHLGLPLLNLPHGTHSNFSSLSTRSSASSRPTSAASSAYSASSFGFSPCMAAAPGAASSPQHSIFAPSEDVASSCAMSDLGEVSYFCPAERAEARGRVLRSLQQLERRRKDARILLVFDDEAGVATGPAGEELRHLFTELLDSTHRLRLLVASRRPVHASFGANKVVNVPLFGLDDQSAARLFLQRIHRPLTEEDLVRPSCVSSSQAAPLLPLGEAQPHPPPALVLRRPMTSTGHLQRLYGHVLLRALAGNPRLLREVSSQVAPGGRNLFEIAGDVIASRGPVGGQRPASAPAASIALS